MEFKDISVRREHEVVKCSTTFQKSKLELNNRKSTVETNIAVARQTSNKILTTIVREIFEEATFLRLRRSFVSTSDSFRNLHVLLVVEKTHFSEDNVAKK
jgi:hypothetical protein